MRHPLHRILQTLIIALVLSGCNDASIVRSDQSETSQGHALAVEATTEQDSTGLIPIMDLLSGTYQGFSGGLYPDGQNLMPVSHQDLGVERALEIVPLDLDGNPDDVSGKYVLLSIGISNATQEFCSPKWATECNPWTFMGKAAADVDVNHATLVVVNGAMGGSGPTAFDDPLDPDYDRIRDEELMPAGVGEAQVSVVWAKFGDKRSTDNPLLPDPGADAFILEANLGNIARALRIRYPNIKLLFLTSRSYAGFALQTSHTPEPYAYEGGFGYKWVIEAQLNQEATGIIDPIAGDLNTDTAAPWIAWGPYWWADGIVPRSDGLTWPREMFESQGSHPSKKGEIQAADLLMDFFKTAPEAQPWFLEPTVSLLLSPRIPTIVIPGGGGSFEYRIELTNESSRSRVFDVWTLIKWPDGTSVGATGPATVTMAAADSLLKSFTQTVDASDPPGTYTFQALIGTYPDGPLSRREIEYTKQ